MLAINAFLFLGARDAVPVDTKTKEQLQHMGPFRYFASENVSYAPPRAPIDAWDEDPGAVIDRVVAKVTRHWAEVGVTRADTQAAGVSMEECIIVHIVTNNVFVSSPNEARYKMDDTTRIRRYEAVQFLSSLASTSPGLPDVEIALCPDDCVTDQDFAKAPFVLRESETTRRATPAFSHVACAMSSNMPFHFWNTDRLGEFSEWDSRTRAISAWRDAHPWDARDGRAVFRGAVRRCYAPREVEPTAATWRHCGRTRLKHLAHTEGLAGAVDVDVGTVPFIDPAVYPRSRHPRLSMREQEAFRAVVNVEGNCGWADRLQIMGFMGTLVVHQETMCKEWYNLAMTPWVHYVPVDYHFDALPAALRWAAAHDADARTLVRNMNALAAALLSQRGIARYTRALLSAYARTLRYRVAAPPEAAEPAADWLARQTGPRFLARIAAHEVAYFLSSHAAVVLNAALFLALSLAMRHAAAPSPTAAPTPAPARAVSGTPALAHAHAHASAAAVAPLRRTDPLARRATSSRAAAPAAPSAAGGRAAGATRPRPGPAALVVAADVDGTSGASAADAGRWDRSPTGTGRERGTRRKKLHPPRRVSFAVDDVATVQSADEHDAAAGSPVPPAPLRLSSVPTSRTRPADPEQGSAPRRAGRPGGGGGQV